MVSHLTLVYQLPSVQRTTRTTFRGEPHAPPDTLYHSSRQLRIDQEQRFPDSRLQLLLGCWGPAAFVDLLLREAPHIFNWSQLRHTGWVLLSV